MADHRPAIPKCTCMTTSGAPTMEKKANRFLPHASSRDSTRPSIARAPSAKRPFGEVALYARPASRFPWETASRCTLCPSTMVLQSGRELGK
eukprot:scaffold32640_cov101-Isochrysis_galbana.AAC.2